MDLDLLKDVKVLLVDDDEDDFFITRKIFSQIPDSPFRLEWVASYEEGMAAIDDDRHDVYLIDYRLGEHNGLDLLEHAHPESRRQPFILLTGAGDTELEWKSLKMAAADYLIKGSFNAAMLARSLFYALQRRYVERQRIEHLIELNQAKDEFISIASHQLRTPATGVKQYLGMVIEGFAGDLPDNQRALLERAYRSNERQLKIVADLLKVAQVDSGKMNIHPSSVDINAMLTDVIAEQQSTVDSREQTIKFNPLEEAQLVELDNDAMRMVFDNLIDNASKYSEHGSTTTVSIEKLDDAVCIEIRDQGVGIEAAELGRLFEKFARINNPLSTKVGGSGLGLYWAKRIIDMHGGRIDYQPNDPHGSVFLVRLPLSPPR